MIEYPQLSLARRSQWIVVFFKLNLRSRILPEAAVLVRWVAKGGPVARFKIVCRQCLQAVGKLNAPRSAALVSLAAVPVAVPCQGHSARVSFILLNLLKPLCAMQLCGKADAIVEGHTIPLERLNRGRAYALSAAYYRVAGLIEAWCQGQYMGILQLNRERLQALLKVLEEQPAVF